MLKPDDNGQEPFVVSIAVSLLLKEKDIVSDPLPVQ